MNKIGVSAEPRTSLQRRREAVGWTIEDLASRAGVSARTVWDAERGNTEPRRATLQALAWALSCRPEDLKQSSPAGSTPGSAKNADGTGGHAKS